MAEQKRRWGDRRDATLLRDVDSLHFIMGIIYPNRADNEAYIAERVNLEPIKAYIAKKNYEGIAIGTLAERIPHIVRAAFGNRRIVQWRLTPFGCGLQQTLIIVHFRLGNPLQADHLFPFHGPDQANPTGISTYDAHFADASPYQSSGIGDEHDLVLLGDLNSPDHLAVAFIHLDRDDTLSTATTSRVFRQRGAFPITIGRGRQYGAVITRDDEGNHTI